jgi:hypothetical protein
VAEKLTGLLLGLLRDDTRAPPQLTTLHVALNRNGEIIDVVEIQSKPKSLSYVT